MIVTLKDYLPEETAASKSLKDAQKAKSTTTTAARALEIFMKLAPDEQEKQLDFLEKALADSGGDLGAVVHSARNRASYKPNGGTAAGAEKMKKLKTNEELAEEIEELMKQSGFSPEFQQQAAELFIEAVEDKAETVAIGSKLREMFRDNPHFSLMFADDEQIDAVELLANRIEELEYAIAECEEESAILRAESLSEEVVFAPSKPTRSRRNLSEDFEANPDNEFLMGENNPGNTVLHLKFHLRRESRLAADGPACSPL